MSDLLGISSTAVAAYQRALGTVSNNIANVSTEGYSRQTSTLAQSAPAKQANMFLGTGVLFTSVKRAFDTFAESNLRNSNTDLATQTPMVEYTQRVMDIMGDDSVGLSSALDRFFESARSLSVDPASGVMRNSFLRSTEGVGSRFAELSGQLNLVSSEMRQALDSSAGQFNTLTEQLSLVNQQLTKGTSLETQPPELLDRRDLLLRQLSEYSRIKTSFTSNGIVSVSLGTTMKQSVVVDGIKFRPVGIDLNSKSKMDMMIDPYGNTEPLSGASGGTFGGLNTFISQVLEPAQKNLDFLAQTFVDEVNKVQKNGIDGYGNMGQPLMKIDVTAVNKAQGIGMVISDPMRVATGALFRVTTNNNNASDVKAAVSYTPAPAPMGVSNARLVSNPFTNNPLPIDVSGGRLFSSVTTLSAGMENPVIYLDNAKPGQQLQLLTKDGRHLIGSEMSVDEKYQLLTAENGFTDPVTLSDAYLNKSGTNGYLNANVFYGAKSTVVSSNDFHSQDSHQIEVIQFANFQQDAYGSALDGTGFASAKDPIANLSGLSLSFQKDGISGTPIPITANTPEGIVNAINGKTFVTGVKAELSQSEDSTYKIILSGLSGASNTFSLNAKSGLIKDEEAHQEPTDSAFTLDGLNYTSNTNVVAGILPDMSLNLKSFYVLDVKQLAKPLQVASAGFSSPSTWLSTVDFDLSVSVNQGDALTIPITAHQSSPQSIVKAINDAKMGVTAELVNSRDGSANPYKIILTSSETGIANAFTLDVEAGGPDLGFDFNVPLQVAQDAQFTLNGNPYSRPGNVQANFRQGITLNLQKLGISTISNSPNFNGVQFKKGDPVLEPAKLETSHIQKLTAGPEGLTVVAKGSITLNGKPLGSLELGAGTSLTPKKVAAWLQKGLDDNQMTDMQVEVFNQVRFNTASLDFHKALSINNVKIGTINQVSKTASEYQDLPSMVKAIQAAQEQTGVTARIAENGDLILENAPGRKGEDIVLGPKDVNGKSINIFNYSLSDANSTIQGQVRLTRSLGDPAKSDIRLSFGAPPNAGSPFDLNMVGFRTAAYVEGKVPDDLQVFVTGAGKATIAASFSGQPIDPQQKLRAQKLVVTFDATDHYTIKDGATGTVLAERHYDNTVLNPVVNYQGLAIKFTRTPDMGDIFAVDGNHDGLGNNENMLVMTDLAKKGVIGNKSFSDSYIDQVNTVGNAAQQAKITQQALTVVNAQAKQSRDKVSGVNLDDEAADLIRFQQAYQAAAKSLQISGQLFDSIVQIR
jgi:flagellar hook-associated protein FlgK